MLKIVLNNLQTMENVMNNYIHEFTTVLHVETFSYCELYFTVYNHRVVSAYIKCNICDIL
jgi:hypothetical protein